MSLNTMFPFQFTYVPDKTPRQGRNSKKTLKPEVTYRGGVYVARHAGRSNKFFGSTPTEALKNLRGNE